MSISNHLLFSEIFFQHIRRETSDLDNLRVTLGAIRDTWRYYLPPPKAHGEAWTPEEPLDLDDVAQLRTLIVAPIFGYLELTYSPCETDDRAFLLYGDWEQTTATALCLVLPYAENIEGRCSKNQPNPPTPAPNLGEGEQNCWGIPKGRNYAQQLLRLLREHELDWGVLTNGRHWRLFHRTELSPTETYLHVDLAQIVATGDMESYIVFHRFFSRPAFVRDGNRQRLDCYKEQSDQATAQIEEHLAAHVEEVVRKLCQGLVESCREEGENVGAAATRKAIYKNALYLVYRLLFVLYAEARDLLPLDVLAYRAVCLRDLLAEVRRNHKEGLSAAEDYALWRRLQALFALIDQGKPDEGVPAYNGGLFDPGRRPFLTQHRIRNAYLQEALIRLSTMPGKGLSYDQDRAPTSIDYRDLSVRHLGSLYEGLLEYTLFVVEDEPRVVRSSRRKTRYVPYSKAGKVRASETVLDVGDVYFSETEGERKATGSYYTPEDVVDYIVRQTVGEKLADLKRTFYAEQAIAQQLADLANTPADLPAHGQIQHALDAQFLRFVREEVLALTILDPAMGSGHFLVNATHAVANFIVEVLNETPWINEAIDTDVATWKRQVAERCIFGVDLNELAVELAKLCLWMTTASHGRPLTFLDHHMRWGNSLVGAWLKDVGIYPGRKKESAQAFTLPLDRFQVDAGEVLDAYAALYAKNSDDVAEVREKARLFDQEIVPRLQPYRELLTLHTAVYFDEGPDESLYARLGAAVHDPAAWTALKTLNALAPRLEALEARRWFHWELEFPEVFATETDGFDVVLGNPPYVSVKTDYFIENNYDTSDSRNLYSYMLELAVKTAKKSNGYFGLVVPLSITSSNSMESVHEYLIKTCDKTYFANFAKRPSKLFPDVELRIAIVFGHTSQAVSRGRFLASDYLRWYSDERQQLFDKIQYSDVTDHIILNSIPKVGSLVGLQILEKMSRQRQTVNDWRLEQENHSRVYFHSVAGYWTKAFDFVPRYEKAGVEGRSSKIHELEVENQDKAHVLVALLNSNLFYWYWICHSDCFDLTRSLIDSFPFSFNDLTDDQVFGLIMIAQSLMEEYKDKSTTMQLNLSSGRITMQQIHPRLSQDLLDSMDEVLSEIYGFSDSEKNFIQLFDRRFRFDYNED